MGMLDTLKRWLGGDVKTAPSKPAPQMRASVPAPSAAPAPVRTPAAQPAPLPIAEALDAISKSSAKTAPAKPAPAPVSIERRIKPRVNAREGTRVLIIDDSPTIVALLKRMIEQSGYTTLEASDAETGVALALSAAPDLIFLDIVLPGMNGFEALRRLRREPASKGIPVIMISGNELATEQFYAQRIGADDFMKKPFSRSEVFARIEKLLDEEKVIRRHVVAPGTGAATVMVPATQVAASPTTNPMAASVAPAPSAQAAIATAAKQQQPTAH